MAGNVSGGGSDGDSTFERIDETWPGIDDVLKNLLDRNLPMRQDARNVVNPLMLEPFCKSQMSPRRRQFPV